MNDRCIHCGEAVAPADRFCEGCGSVLCAVVRRVAVPGPVSESAEPCIGCGSEAFVDDYCASCGQRRTGPDRDESRLDGIVLISDRGLEHVTNDDAAAAGTVAENAEEPPHALVVAVCDGVSTSKDAYLAAVAASTAGVDAMLTALAVRRDARAAVVAGLAKAAKAAAVGSEAGAFNGPSCTYVAAAVVRTSSRTIEIAVGNVGDSRAYWLPGTASPAMRLTVDDSVAQELITAGAPADSAPVQAGAHTLTRWFGADAGPIPWTDAGVQSISTSGPGVLLLCTDGLWNYLPAAEDIAAFCEGADTATAAQALVDHALRCGGADNVTVALIPIGGSDGMC
jgi:serine/threonine protein phosphatase PrpC